ncbi:MAG: hypothetical protein D6771_08905, partial [Zetaproteobacteria bacterium]
NLFVAVATGQNVANLPPILQFAEKGDQVLWLESDLASRQGWANGAIAVLKGRGIESIRAPIEGNINDPRAVKRALAQWLERHGGNYRTLNIVLNGGQKLTPFGLALAARPWRELGKPVRFLYGDDRPARVQVREQHVGGPMRTVAYDAERMLRLEEIVRAAGREIESVSEPLPWRDPPPPDPYGRDAAFTALVHASAKRRGAEEEARAHWPGFNAWSRESKQAFNQRMTPILEDLAGKPLPREAKFAAYPRIVRLIREFAPRLPSPGIARADKAKLIAQGWWTDRGRPNIGPRFERAVANRIRRFLAERPALAKVIRELRLNAKVPGAEWDVVLVLVNGILLHLECKTWRVSKKDMDARIHVMRSASSRLAQTCLVAPMFPEFADKPWFCDMHDNFQRMLGFGVPVLAYTMEGARPAQTYRIPGRQGEFRWPDPFEEALERLLAPYVCDAKA